MSNLLQLAQTLQQKSQEELNNTNEMVQNAIKQHEQNLLKQLQDASETIEHAIQSEKTRLIKRTIAFWRLPSLIMGSVFLAALATTGGLVWQAKKTYQAMQDWKQSAENYQAVSQKLKIKNCKINETESKPCIAINPQYQQQSWGDGKKTIMKIIAE